MTAEEDIVNLWEAVRRLQEDVDELRKLFDEHINFYNG